MLKSSLLNEEARQKDKESNIEYYKALVTKTASSKGRGRQRDPQNGDKSRSRSKVQRKAHVFLLC